jgi:glycolate oxidase FAD binding subunit
MGAPVALSLEDAAAQLAAIAGDAPAALHAGAIEVAPANTQQISQILRFASGNGLAVSPVGAYTKRTWGNPVLAPVRLSLKRMHAVREHSWQDMTCTVEAGCNWGAMQAALRQHGQMVALDPLWPDRATVGGVVAANDSGALRLRYGGLRDLIIGMTIVLADGTIAKTGGKVVKNVAGYDLHKLMTGSCGTLGVIADVNFRLHPVEGSARTWSARGKSAAHFQAPLGALAETQIVPSSVQLRIESGVCSLDIRIAAVPACLDQHADELTRIFASMDLREADETVWTARQQLFGHDTDLIAKVSLLPGELCSAMHSLEQSSAAAGVAFRAVAQGHGLAAIALGGDRDSLISSVNQLRARLRTSGGSVTVLHLPDACQGGLDVWGDVGSTLPLMREIKKRFDPAGILNPGRFVGNI